MANRGQVFLGASILVIGVFLLIEAVTRVNIWRFIWPLAIIGLGVWLILRPRMAGPGTTVRTKLLGDIRRSGIWSVEDEEVWLGVGDVALDMTDAVIPAGETRLRVSGFVAEVKLKVPQEVGIAVRSSAFLTTARVLGEKRDIFLTTYEASSTNYLEAERRIRLETTFVVADLKVRHGA